MRLTDLPLDRPVATVMLLVCLTVMGAVAIAYLPLGFLPVVQEPEIDVFVPFPGSHPLEGLREVGATDRGGDRRDSGREEDVRVVQPGERGCRSPVRLGRGSQDQDDGGARCGRTSASERMPANVGHISVQGDTDGPGASILHGRISAKRDLSESWELLDRRIRRPSGAHPRRGQRRALRRRPARGAHRSRSGGHQATRHRRLAT